MEVESHPTLEELANGQPGQNGGTKDLDAEAAGDSVVAEGTIMPAPAGVLSGTEDQRLKKKARRLIRTSSRDGSLVIPGQASAFVAPHRR